MESERLKFPNLNTGLLHGTVSKSPAAWWPTKNQSVTDRIAMTDGLDENTIAQNSIVNDFISRLSFVGGWSRKIERVRLRNIEFVRGFGIKWCVAPNLHQTATSPKVVFWTAAPLSRFHTALLVVKARVLTLLPRWGSPQSNVQIEKRLSDYQSWKSSLQ